MSLCLYMLPTLVNVMQTHSQQKSASNTWNLLIRSRLLRSSGFNTKWTVRRRARSGELIQFPSKHTRTTALRVINEWSAEKPPSLSKPFGHYVFRVLARNGVGDSSPTRVKDVCITPPKQPDRNPSGVWAKGASPENIVVHWRPMSREEWNGKNFHYKI
ncbi:hypothetical protein OSTOST_02666, partial [Ostertagia ostertagi]